MNTIKYAYTILCTLLLFSACRKDEETLMQPSTISNITTTPLSGAIKISWTRDEPVTYEYVKVTYFDKLKKQEMQRLASRYSDTIIIPDTRAKYGDYHFTLQPFSSTGTGGVIMQVSGKSGIAPKNITVVDTKKLSLKTEDLFTDAQEPSEGPIKNLLDGKNNTFFHSAWSVDKGPMPHYIVVKLPWKVNGFTFTYVTRDNDGAGNHVKEMNVYVSNQFDGNTYNVEGLTPVAEFANLPGEKMQTFNSDNIILDGEYQYIWFQAKQTHGNTKFFAWAELSVSEVKVKIVDPEAPTESD